MYERALSRSTHDLMINLMMISLDCPSPLPRTGHSLTRHSLTGHSTQQRAPLLLHDAEVGDDGPDDEKDEEQAS